MWGYSLAKFVPAADGLTVEIRRAGRSRRKPALQVGVARAPIVHPRFVEGPYFVHRECSTEVMVVTSEGVFFGMGVSRKEGREEPLKSRGLGRGMWASVLTSRRARGRPLPVVSSVVFRLQGTP